MIIVKFKFDRFWMPKVDRIHFASLFIEIYIYIFNVNSIDRFDSIRHFFLVTSLKRNIKINWKFHFYICGTSIYINKWNG